MSKQPLRMSGASSRVRSGDTAYNTMQMTLDTPFQNEAAYAAPLTREHSPVIAGRTFDDVLALAERYAT